jgi:2-hydroxy-6-oxonona-2,4-dienedioate hydrolase
VALQAANVPRDRMHRRKLALTDLLARTLPTLKCRVDAIYGEQDALYREVLPALGTKLSEGKVREFLLIPGAGHWVPYEDAPAFHAALGRLFASR